jgi:hypothetical protein
MLSHVKVLAWLHILFGAVGLLIALFFLFLLGGIAAFVGSVEPGPDARIAVPVLSGIGGLLFILVAALSVPGIVVGIGMLKLAPWARILGLVMSAIELLNVPLGTALGIYGLWVLTKRETEALFVRSPA